ncbi:MAG TPA: CHAT domain-containing protein, partial [Polyangiales bacterium]|nr:CHAT domain-containing protein [Polyangiales bacterium]
SPRARSMGAEYVLRRRARAELARISLQEADYAAAVGGLSTSFDEALSLGRVSEAIYDGTALAFVLSANLRRFEAARGVLARVEAVAAKDDAGRALLPHYQGVLALETGDTRLALRLFREAVRATARLGLHEHEHLAREQEAWTLSLLGQHAAAIAAQRTLADTEVGANGCKRADRYESVVWYALLAGADAGLTDIARDYSERALRALQGCTSPWRQRNHAVNWGLLSEQRGDLAAVQAALQALSSLQVVEDPVLEAWELLLRGRYALQAGAAERALATFRQALTACRRHGLWEPALLAQLGVARALKALEGSAAALRAYRDAEELLDRSLQRAPLAEGLGGARHAREAGTYELMELLLQQRDTAAALAVARRARARSLMLHSAQERVPSLSDHDRARWETLLTRYHASREQTATLRETAWELPRARQRERTREIADSERAAREALDEAMGMVLADPWRDSASETQHSLRAEAEPEGRATLALFAGVRGIHGFVYGCGPLRQLELSAADDGAVRAGAWLAPFVADLACASELRVIAPASLGAIDVASWELAGAPVLERWAVSYALDVPQRTAAGKQQGTLRVVDPRANLPLAAREAELTVPSGFGPLRTWTGAAANRGDVLRELPGLALFHYAGHHRFAGAEGADSELLLAGATLSVGDVLTLRAAPRFVVLSACDSARLEAPGFSAGMDLAYAFVLSGTQAVVAATRPVHDQLGYAMSAALYAELPAEPSERDVVRALRAAQLRVRRALPEADWSAFRVITH